MTTENETKYYHVYEDGSIRATSEELIISNTDIPLDYRYFHVSGYLVTNIDTYDRAVAIAIAFELEPHDHAA